MNINVPKLMETFEANGLMNVWVDNIGRITHENATPEQLTLAEQLRDAHNPAELSTRQTSIAQLTAFLDNHADDLKYADYFYRLKIRLMNLWRPPHLSLTNRITEVISAVKGNRDTDPTHSTMYNVFLNVVEIEYGLTVTNGEIVFSGTAQQQAVQARTTIQCARQFCSDGVEMANMLLLNKQF